jgi:hypothetical protein
VLPTSDKVEEDEPRGSKEEFGFQKGIDYHCGEISKGEKKKAEANKKRNVNKRKKRAQQKKRCAAEAAETVPVI